MSGTDSLEYLTPWNGLKDTDIEWTACFSTFMNGACNVAAEIYVALIGLIKSNRFFRLQYRPQPCLDRLKLCVLVPLRSTVSIDVVAGKFVKGTREGIGRPPTAVMQENIELVRELVKQNPRVI